ncbi:insecticidal delta-endotoxin Cry8Ea1 family protein, partial [Bacillus cereus]|uniref:insecticidal delta-endotoxin Cry8Ea1 family protein n=1 Tax=Bacillus cereus TaxID=1396 RepID=UPI000BEB730F
MNSNDNKNEFQIMDNGHTGYQPRYPLTQVPGSELRNMNYKDWLARFPYDNAFIPAENLSIRDAIITSTNIISYLLSIPLPGFGVAAGILGALLGWLWPTNTEAIWEAFMDAVETLINQKIEKYARSKAISELRGIHGVLELYQDAVSNLQKDPQNEKLKEVVRIQYQIANSIIVDALPSFRVPGYEVPLLTAYTEAANLHLLLLRDGITFGASWGMDTVTISTQQIYLEKLTRVYTDNCVSTYNVGLEKAKTLVADLCDLNTYPWTRYNQGFREEEKPNCSLQQINRCDQQLNAFHVQGNPYMASFRWAPGEYQKLENWNLYNAFRRDMTIMVLDLVALWPTYNPTQYLLPVKVELTREIYTDIRGTTYRSDESQNTLSAIEKRMIPTPSLFRWLSSFTFHLRNVQGDWTAGQIATGLQQTVQTTLGPPQFISLIGTQGTSTTTLAPLDYLDGITWIDTQQWFEPRWFQFWSGGYNTDWKLQRILGSIDEKNPFWAEGPRWRVYSPSARANEIPEHRLSWITYEPIRSNSPFGWTEYKQLGALALGWTHQSVDPENRIVSDRITQIPAVKGYLVDHGATVVKGPGSTGGDLVRLPAYNNQGTQLRIKVKPSERAKGRAYKVRIRYASEANANLFVGKYVDAVNRFYETGNYAVSRTFSGSMIYDSFRYLDTFSFSANENEFKIELRCNSGGPIYIDKIECIPLTPQPESIKGTYQIITALNNSSVVDMDQSPPPPNQSSPQNVRLWENANATNQKWNFVYDASKAAYQIQNSANQEKVLTWLFDVEKPLIVAAVS